jgi:pimeloyl-ACP methyl ester carboxylesterase
MTAPSTITQSNEDHFFFEPSHGDGFLYARACVPEEPTTLGVVVVPPVGRERVRVCAEMAVLGRDIAAAGYPVLRFDYRGDGESSGAFNQSTVSTRVADTVAAADELRRRSGVERVALVGIHLGAVIAALAAGEAAASLLLLCDPVCQTRTYVANLLRTVVFQQRQQRDRAAPGESTLGPGFGHGRTVNIFGYDTSGDFLRELEEVDPVAALRAFRGHSGILYFTNRPAEPAAPIPEWAAHLGAPSRSFAAPIVMNFSWTTRRQWAPRLGPLNTAIINWLDARRHDPSGHGHGGRA